MSEPTLPTPPPDSLDAGERLHRLRRLGVRRGRAGLATAAGHASEGSPAPDGLSTSPEPSTPATDLAQRIGAQEVFTPYGPCLVAESRYPLSEPRGGVALGAVLAQSGAAVAACARNQALAGFDFRHAAFIDTETTGLAGGAGTFAFMVGIGTFEAGDSPDKAGGLAYVVRQVFMRHPGEEHALLYAAASILAACSGLVSFNGRAFDAPLLTTRFIMHHEPRHLDDMLHLDLLPPSRQRWRQRLDSCALGVLEREVLAFQRSQEDVPGWLIPSIYQEFARSGASADMEGVFYHNREDIVSMVPLAAVLCAPFEEHGQAAGRHELHPVEAAGLGRCFEELGWLEVSERVYRAALAQGLPAEVRSQTLHRLGWLLKRQERRGEAVAIWEEWITSVPGPDPTPYEELAKHHEWHEVDLAAARKWTLWGLHTAQLMPPGPRREQSLQDLRHRLERLERKLSGLDD